MEQQLWQNLGNPENAMIFPQRKMKGKKAKFAFMCIRGFQSREVCCRISTWRRKKIWRAMGKSSYCSFRNVYRMKKISAQLRGLQPPVTPLLCLCLHFPLRPCQENKFNDFPFISGSSAMPTEKCCLSCLLSFYWHSLVQKRICNSFQLLFMFLKTSPFHKG